MSMPLEQLTELSPKTNVLSFFLHIFPSFLPSFFLSFLFSCLILFIYWLLYVFLFNSTSIDQLYINETFFGLSFDFFFCCCFYFLVGTDMDPVCFDKSLHISSFVSFYLLFQRWIRLLSLAHHDGELAGVILTVKETRKRYNRFRISLLGWCI